MAKVLIVDDYEEIRQVLDLTLRRTGWDIRWASDGIEACEKAAEDPPDIVFLDVAMPGMDGIEVCQRLRADEATADTLIVIVTAGQRAKLRDLSRQAGADAFVQKPFSPTELISLVQGLLGESGGERGDPDGG